MLSKLFALLFVLSLTIGLQILSYIYGWGMQPRSWWWIIGVGIFGHAFSMMIAQKIVKEK
jgi:RsiW-degrading membrane proteinase PrsW (M82 family)